MHRWKRHFLSCSKPSSSIIFKHTAARSLKAVLICWVTLSWRWRITEGSKNFRWFQFQLIFHSIPRTDESFWGGDSEPGPRCLSEPWPSFWSDCITRWKSKPLFSLASVVNIHTVSPAESWIFHAIVQNPRLWVGRRVPIIEPEITCYITWKASRFHLGFSKRSWFWSCVGVEGRGRQSRT